MTRRPLTRLIGGLPHATKRRLKKLRYLPETVWRGVADRGPQDTPPRWLLFDSANNYRATGEHLLALCRDYALLSPEHSVLDIGCGVGRLAQPVTKYLSASGSYDGFDVDEEAIAWCAKNIRDRAPAVSFRHIEVLNDHYNREAGQSAAELSFPYADDRFDVIVATSVFTHLTRDEAQRYLSEAARVLKPEGLFLSTWYLVSADGVSDDASPQHRFRYVVDDDCYTDTPANPCAGMAFNRDRALALFAEAGLDLRRDPLLGQWQQDDGPTFQDLLVAGRARSADGPTTSPSE